MCNYVRNIPPTPPPPKGLRTQGPVFQNGVRPGVSLNLTKSATKPKITFFKTA